MSYPVKSACYCFFNYSETSLNNFKLAGASTLLVASGIITALSLAQTVPFQCLYGAGALFVLDVALASVIFAKKPKIENSHNPVPVLHDELWLEIFRYLDLKTLLTASTVCRAWSVCANDPLLLKGILGHKYVIEDLNLQKVARSFWGFKRRQVPSYQPNSPVEVSWKAGEERIIACAGHHAVLIRDNIFNILYGERDFVKFTLKGKIDPERTFLDESNLYYLSVKTLFIGNLKNQNVTKHALSECYYAFCVSETKFIFVGRHGVQIFAKEGMALIKTFDYSLDFPISAYKEKIYYLNWPFVSITEFDIETGKKRVIYKTKLNFFSPSRERIRHLFLFNGVIFFQLLGDPKIFRYDIDRKKWLSKLPCPEGYALQGAFCGLVVASNGKESIFWDFRA